MPGLPSRLHCEIPLCVYKTHMDIHTIVEIITLLESPIPSCELLTLY